MGGTRAGLRLSLFACLVFAAASCGETRNERRHGYVPVDGDLNKIVVGVDTRAAVAEQVGLPSASGVLADRGWYYVESTFTAYGLREPHEIDREVVAISFDDDGVVENIERFGLEDGRVIAISRRVTDSSIRGVGLLRQLFGNVGNFTAEQLLN